MEESTNVTKSYEQVFLLDEGKLRKIVDIIVQNFQKKDIESELIYGIARRNNSSLKTKKIEDIFEDDNTKHKEITSITISAREKSNESRYNSKTNCTVKFELSKYSFSNEPQITLDIKDEDKGWCLILAEDLDTQMKRIVTKKRWLNFISLLDALLPFFLITLLFLLLGFFSEHNQINNENISQISLEGKIDEILQYERNNFIVRHSIYSIIGWILAIVSILVAFVVLLSELAPFSKLQKSLNKSVFYWGDQKESYDKRKTLVQNIKWTILIGFIVSLLAGAFIAFFQSK